MLPYFIERPYNFIKARVSIPSEELRFGIYSALFIIFIVFVAIYSVVDIVIIDDRGNKTCTTILAEKKTCRIR